MTHRANIQAYIIAPVSDAPQRQEWAVEVMRIGARDRVLEIGCGHGVAVSLICAQLKSGKVTAIDRSAAMIRMASQRNAEHVAAGRAEFRIADLDSADLPTLRFDKVFSVNVSLFWLGTSPSQIAKVKRLLAPGGALYVFHEPPKPGNLDAIADRTEAGLVEHGFAIRRYQSKSRRGLPLSCVEGHLV